MAKAIGLIGNYTGKLGNTVGYNLKDSNNKQTQGVRVYQPVVKNPRTAGQAEQRAKLAPVNATYRLLKDVIDRGQEGVAYGNKSRLAWLKQTLKSFNGPWFEKGADVTMPVLCPISSGSLPDVLQPFDDAQVCGFPAPGIAETDMVNIGSLSRYLVTTFPSLQYGDQITFIRVANINNYTWLEVESIILNQSSTSEIPSAISWTENELNVFSSDFSSKGNAIVISREGDNGEHLRSTSYLKAGEYYDSNLLTPAAKAAAIASYMSQSANTDWAEESIM